MHSAIKQGLLMKPGCSGGRKQHGLSATCAKPSRMYHQHPAQHGHHDVGQLYERTASTSSCSSLPFSSSVQSGHGGPLVAAGASPGADASASTCSSMRVYVMLPLDTVRAPNYFPRAKIHKILRQLAPLITLGWL